MAKIVNNIFFIALILLSLFPDNLTRLLAVAFYIEALGGLLYRLALQVVITGGGTSKVATSG